MAVEDNSDDLLLLRRVLRDTGYPTELVIAKSAEEALELVAGDKAGHIHMILLDINLPGMNGIELLSNFRSLSWLQSIPMLILTTSVVEEDFTVSFKYHADGFLIKPYGLEGHERLARYLTLSWFGTEPMPEDLLSEIVIPGIHYTDANDIIARRTKGPPTR